MKKKAYFFLIAAALILLVAPVYNLATKVSLSNIEKIKWWKASFLYNIDFVLPVVGGAYESLGVSINPGQVVLGKSGWFFLGDDHAQSISIKRAGVTPQNLPVVESIVNNQLDWQRWLARHGVKQYRVLIGPDKDSIYPEFLPNWAAHSARQVSAELLQRAGPDLYVDAFTPLLQDKGKYPPLYFKSDTHWNRLGAWVAFKALSENLGRAEPELLWPNSSLAKVDKIVSVPGGDLSRFQRVEEWTRDHDIVLDDENLRNLSIEQIDYDTLKSSSTGRNEPLEAPRKPLLVVSAKALNNKRVLWLRDSFGISLSPFVAQTFSQVLQVHYDSVDADKFAELVESFKPDYVIFSAVERVSRMGLFLAPPPTFTVLNNKNQFVMLSEGQISSVNDVALHPPGNYQIIGGDPYVVASIKSPITGLQARHLTFDLGCPHMAEEKFPVQIFWSTKLKGFNEPDSATFFVKQGVTSVDISTANGWPKEEAINEVRLDIVNPATCPSFSIKDIALGKR
jgi:alginate O-acetyltransferase complex protein AlgJ